MYGNEISKVLLSKEQLRTRVQELGEAINRDFEGKKMRVVCILRGAFIFCADLVRELKGNVEIDFIVAASYGAGASTSGTVKLLKDLAEPIDGLDVLIVEDIIDSGVTLKFVKELFADRKPNSVKICALLDKPSRRKVQLEGDYIGFTVGNEFVVGYGLDYNQKFRYLPEICVLAPEVYGGKSENCALAPEDCGGKKDADE